MKEGYCKSSGTIVQRQIQIFSVSVLALFAAGAFSMRSAGCVINDLWDRDVDSKVSAVPRRQLPYPQVERTRSRPLASGEVHPAQAVALLAGLLSVSLGVLTQLSTARYTVVGVSIDQGKLQYPRWRIVDVARRCVSTG